MERILEISVGKRLEKSVKVAAWESRLGCNRARNSSTVFYLGPQPSSRMQLRSAIVIVYFCVAYASCQFFNVKKILNFGGLALNQTGNELWRGLIRDCDQSVTFSCIQKNAYAYLDNVFTERDNITVFEGLTMTKNGLNYGTCLEKGSRDDSMDENLVEGSSKDDCDEEESEGEGEGRQFGEEQSPLEEVTNSLRKRVVKFLANRDYQIQLPDFFFEGATIKISPREVDENGALVKLDFGQRGLESQGRIFKKIKKFIQNKLLTSLLALLIIIKLIKVKFMFVIPFLFGVGAAKKLFLKLLLFFIPAFAHVFKLCSSYYSAHSTKYHHHHHQIAHHHHHVPVPVPVPTYYNHHHHHRHEDEFDGYDYAHPHIQYRKDIEELKEWGIEPYEEPYEVEAGPAPARPPPGKRPLPSAHNLAYSAYADNNRRTASQSASPANVVVNVPSNPANLPSTMLPTATNLKNSYAAFGQQNAREVSAKSGPADSKVTAVTQRPKYDDYYGPIINRLEEIFKQLRFAEESCRERLVCSMYKNPSVYSPHSNLVSNELSRDPQELKRTEAESSSSQKFHRYFNAARLGQDGGDCLRTYPCHINTE
ncbi:hypothetical protein WN51_08360 [Melipona quadrifasciata]|uniref:Uncharacterized protein n=1 Tax=Melipona quadrifasciata TaxID=166423 RepID=A0A0M9AC08_9HYME|nr:hypothetical protein WN51_08360 [Melipona quadrifasciata]